MAGLLLHYPFLLYPNGFFLEQVQLLFISWQVQTDSKAKVPAFPSTCLTPGPVSHLGLSHTRACRVVRARVVVLVQVHAQNPDPLFVFVRLFSLLYPGGLLSLAVPTRPD